MANTNFNDLIKFNSGSMIVDDYPTIVQKLTDKYKEIYGSDIDITNESADGVFIHNIALLINNVLQSMVTLYSSLDVNYATGEVLDKLCALSNIRRKQPTKSSVNVNVTWLSTISPISIPDSGLMFIDKAGVMWSYKGALTFSASETKALTLTCEEVGKIIIPANWIESVVGYSGFAITQTQEGIVGEDLESDSALRSRRNQSGSPMGITVLESLKGALLQVAGIRDCYIYGGTIDDGHGTHELPDNAEISLHNIYIALRYDNATINEDYIAKLIYERLTPGINTESTVTTPLNGTIVTKSQSVDVGEYLQFIYWKKCSGDNPPIVIELKKNAYYSVNELDSIKSQLIDYLNSLEIGTDLIEDDLKLKLLDFDPTFKGRPTYSVNSVTIDSSDSYTNPITYYNYTDVDITINVI